jgi:hypothetical protein
MPPDLHAIDSSLGVRIPSNTGPEQPYVAAVSVAL